MRAAVQKFIMPPEYQYFSIVPLDAQLRGVTIEHAKYPLRDAVVTRAGMISISNEAAAGQTFTVTIAQGRAMVIFSARPAGPLCEYSTPKPPNSAVFSIQTVLQFIRRILAKHARKAYNETIERRKGSALPVALKPISRIAAGVQASTTLAIVSLFKQMKAEGKDVVGFGAGEPDFPTPEHIKQAGIEAIENNFTKYTPAAGLMELREAACYRLKTDFGLEYEPKQIVVASGAKHSVYIALMTLCNPGDEVVIAAPLLGQLLRDGQAGGRRARDRDRRRGAGLQDHRRTAGCCDHRQDQGVMLNSPCNPTGMVYTRAELEAIAEVCCRRISM